MSESATYLNPEILARIVPLGLRAQRVVEGTMSGLHRSPLHGLSVEFADYREYVPGDDLEAPRLAGLRPQQPLLHQALRRGNEFLRDRAGRCVGIDALRPLRRTRRRRFHEVRLFRHARRFIGHALPQTARRSRFGPVR